MLRRLCLSVVFSFGMLLSQVQAQAPADTVRKYQDSIPGQPKAPWYKSKVVRAVAVPTVLIGYGLSTIKDNGIYSSYDARRDILRTFPNFDTWLDDPLLVAPYVELALVNVLNVRSDHDFLNTTLLILKAEAFMAATVFGLKEITNLERPNGENRKSMPSGHTAQAFLAASIVHSELKFRSRWYGVGAYTIATSVGAFRMLKNKHWQSDVFVGAGIGILSSHLAYLSHRNRWGRKPFTLAPMMQNGAYGLYLSIPLGSSPKQAQFLPANR